MKFMKQSDASEEPQKFSPTSNQRERMIIVRINFSEI